MVLDQTLDFGFKKVRKLLQLKGVGLPWMDSQRYSAQNPSPDAQNGTMATRLAEKMYRLGVSWVRAWLAHPRINKGSELIKYASTQIRIPYETKAGQLIKK